MSKPHDEPQGWLEKPSTHTLIFRVLLGLCALLLVADFFYHRHHDQPYESWPLFYPVFGFAAYSFIVLTAKQLRKLLKRSEDFYE